MEVTLLLCTMISNYAKLWNIVILLLLSHLIRFTYHLTCFLPLGNITKQLFCQVRTAVGKQTHYRPSHRSTCPLGKEETVEKVTISYDPKKKKYIQKNHIPFTRQQLRIWKCQCIWQPSITIPSISLCDRWVIHMPHVPQTTVKKFLQDRNEVRHKKQPNLFSGFL